MIRFRHKGDFKELNAYLTHLKQMKLEEFVERFGQRGVDALWEATPKDTGKTANSWRYYIEKTKRGFRIVWANDNTVNGTFNVAAMIQYGHGTGSGEYVPGIDYINPAMKSTFDKIAEDVWKEVMTV